MTRRRDTGSSERGKGSLKIANISNHLKRRLCRPRKIVTVVRKRASILGWSVIAPDRILPPVLKKPMREIRSAASSAVSPLC